MKVFLKYNILCWRYNHNNKTKYRRGVESTSTERLWYKYEIQNRETVVLKVRELKIFDEVSNMSAAVTNFLVRRGSAGDRFRRARGKLYSRCPYTSVKSVIWSPIGSPWKKIPAPSPDIIYIVPPHALNKAQLRTTVAGSPNEQRFRGK